MSAATIRKSGWGSPSMMVLLALGLLLFIGWAASFHIDQGVRASGQVISSAHTQIIQAVDGGVLSELRVAEGQQVKLGEVLAVLEKSRAEAGFEESRDKVVYMRGKWADYTKTTASSGTKLVFTRTVNGASESVTVNAGTEFNFDKLVFADGSVTTFNASNAIATNPAGALVNVVDADPTTVTPLYDDDQVAAALNTIRQVAQANSAGPNFPDASVYAAAGVRSVSASGVNANLASLNSALNSALVDGDAVGTAAKIQTLVDAYNAILFSADGNATPNTASALTGAQYSAIGVTGVGNSSAAVSDGTALRLLDNVVDVSQRTAVDTQDEVQRMADAANHVMASAGGSQPELVTLADLQALGITGVNSANLVAAQNAIQAVANDSQIDTRAELQGVVNAGLASITAAVARIAAAAQANTAAATLGASDYRGASVSGVTAANLASINSALDSVAITSAQADTTPEIQAIVDAYNAILASADGLANTTTPLSAEQYAAIGVSGVAGPLTPGSALSLLDSAVDLSQPNAVDSETEVQAMADAAASARSGVDTEPEVQALAQAAADVLGAAGGTAQQAQALTQADFGLLGVTGVTAANLDAVRAAVQHAQDTGVDMSSAAPALATTLAVPSAVWEMSTEMAWGTCW